MALVADPQVLFLDEPSTGLDPRSRRELWAVVGNLVSGGVTVFLTTQNLEEADQLASRVALLDRGAVVAEGAPAELKQLVPSDRPLVRSATLDDVFLALTGRPAEAETAVPR